MDETLLDGVIYLSAKMNALEQENAKLKAELEKSQCMLAGFMVAEDQEKAALKERVAKLERLLNDQIKTMENYVNVHCYRCKGCYMCESLKKLEASDDKQD